MKAKDTVLEVVHSGEPRIQEHLRRWNESAANRAGAPRWMEALSFDCRGARRKLPGLDIAPDALATDGKRNFVVELKAMNRPVPKYEHAGLAQVFHHAQVLSNSDLEIENYWIPGAPVVPVLVAPWTPWLHESVAWLRCHNVSEEAFRFVEFVELRWGSRKESLFWFDEVQADTAWSAISSAPISTADKKLAWFKRRSANDFRGVPTRLKSMAGLDDTTTFVAAAPLGGDASEVWLKWRGSKSSKGEYWIARGA
jgi:hypothetical protein